MGRAQSRLGHNPRVTLDVDTSSPIRSLARYRDLVSAIYEAPASTQETHALEWKREADAQEKRWRTVLSKQVLGFANRDPDVAATWFGGCAYVAVGVSPGVLNGTAVYDAAKIESWLTPYVGRAPNAPEWNSAYVEVGGKQVLVLTIEPPKWGDPIWTCRKEFLADPKTAGDDPKLALRDGSIYVRHKASTEEANSADMEMLQRRLAGSRRRISGISLIVAPGSRAVSLDSNEDIVAAWAEREREAVKPAPPAPPPKREVSVTELADSSLQATVKMLAEMTKQINYPLVEPDRRTAEDYQKEVDTYIAKATKVLPALVIRRAYDQRLGRIALSVRNNTDDPIHQLQVELLFGAKGVMAVSEDVNVPDVALPKRPIMLGKATRSRFGALDAISLSSLRVPSYDRYLGPSVRAIGRGVKIDNSNSARLTFDPLDLYPQETADLDEFYLFTSIDHTDATLTGEWTARARDVSGVIRGTLGIEVDLKVPTIDDLLAEADEAEDEEDGN